MTRNIITPVAGDWYPTSKRFLTFMSLIGSLDISRHFRVTDPLRRFFAETYRRDSINLSIPRAVFVSHETYWSVSASTHSYPASTTSQSFSARPAKGPISLMRSAHREKIIGEHQETSNTHKPCAPSHPFIIHIASV